MNEKVDQRMKASAFGYCGINCESCPVFVATVNDDEQLQRRTFEEWSKLYADYLGKDLTAKDMHCRGCRSTGSVFAGCLNCPIRRCCSEKKYATCADCGEFKSCGMLNGFYSVPVHQSAKDNLERLRVR